MIKRNVLFVDDDPKIERVYFPRYRRIAKEIKVEKKYSEYELEFHACNSIISAKELLEGEHLIVDAVIVDYDLKGTNKKENGVALINYIRQKVNKKCKVIFYTMNGVSLISQDELIDLINNDVYRLVDKGKTDDETLIGLIYEAVYDGDVILAALERFWHEYSDALSANGYSFMGKQISFEEIIKHIRMDDETGRTFIDKFIHKALLESVTFRG